MKNFVIISFILLFVNICSNINACMSSGVCGCGQTSSCGCRAKAMGAVIKRCYDEICPPGYSCEKYGCTRNKIYGSVISKSKFVIPDDEIVNRTNDFKNGIIPNLKVYNEEILKKKIKFINNQKLDMFTFQHITNPNFLFKECCKDRKLPNSCVEKCDFNSFTKKSLHSMFLGYDTCPIQAGAEMQYCAAQGRDHRKCCEFRGVNNTIAGNKCLDFCDQRPGKILDLDFSYIPCFDIFETIKSCFYEEVKYHAQNLLMNKFAL